MVSKKTLEKMKKVSGENKEFVEYNLYKKNQETNNVDLLLKDNLYFEPTGFIFQKTFTRKQENENTRKYGMTSVSNTVQGFFLEDEDCDRVEFLSQEEPVKLVLPPSVIKTMLKFGSIEPVTDENGDNKKWNIVDTESYSSETIAFKFVVGEKFKAIKESVKAFILKPTTYTNKNNIKCTALNVNLIYNELLETKESETQKQASEVLDKANKVADKMIVDEAKSEEESARKEYSGRTTEEVTDEELEDMLL